MSAGSDMFDLWLKGLTPATGRLYGMYLRRLFEQAQVTPEQAVEETTRDIQTYVKLKNLCNNFTPRGRHAAIFALRRFLYDNGIVQLPPARVPTPTNSRLEATLTWSEANSIIASARKPYNLVLKMMLHCGWGISEFLKFNTPQNWDAAKSHLETNPNAEYFRVNFNGRKRNRSKFYSLIPTFLLKEILSVVEVPIKASHGFTLQGNHKIYHTQGVPLDVEHYHSARTYIETAWRTALKHAPVRVNGHSSPHELRDTFRTKAAYVRCAAEAAEYAMGHTIDPLNYNRCYHNQDWLWSELKKIHAPEGTLNESEMQRRVKEYIEIHFAELVDERFNKLVHEKQINIA
jgi:integrase